MPQLDSCASSGCARRFWAAWHSQGEALPPGPHPPPRALERASSKAAEFAALLTVQPCRYVVRNQLSVPSMPASILGAQQASELRAISHEISGTASARRRD